LIVLDERISPEENTAEKAGKRPEATQASAGK